MKSNQLISKCKNFLVDKCFRDSQGRIVVAQPANLPLKIWFYFGLASLILSRFSISYYLGLIRDISLIYWAYLEIRYGVNLWRRFLGLIVLIVVITGRIKIYY
ncbi:hypothetical protein KC853_00520 [Candidatus Saccharibacteria bacterium]|nr:hypothetical protein [Candidatus Saccharibacteria bacterium]MCB9835026.1 hypothetical protein [Candidatus Nomurabacteria bacterium]